MTGIPLADFGAEWGVPADGARRADEGHQGRSTASRRRTSAPGWRTPRRTGAPPARVSRAAGAC